MTITHTDTPARDDWIEVNGLPGCSPRTGQIVEVPDTVGSTPGRSDRPRQDARRAPVAPGASWPRRQEANTPPEEVTTRTWAGRPLVPA